METIVKGIAGILGGMEYGTGVLEQDIEYAKVITAVRDLDIHNGHTT